MEELTKEIIESAQHYVDKVVDAPLKEIGGLLSDTVGYWRFKNKVNTILKAKRFLERKGIEPKKLLPDIFVPLIEEAGNTNDEKLSEMFSNLLANHLNPITQDSIHPSYAKTLSQLSSLDALILNNYFSSVTKSNAVYRKYGLKIEAVIVGFTISENIALLSFQNLWRLGICDHGDGLANLNREKQIVFTDFGFNFIKACNTE
jgi:hypothetical protein